MLSLLVKVGFDGFLLDDHVPRMEGDTDWLPSWPRHAIGYMQGLLRMLSCCQKARPGSFFHPDPVSRSSSLPMPSARLGPQSSDLAR